MHIFFAVTVWLVLKICDKLNIGQDKELAYKNSIDTLKNEENLKK